METKQGQIFLSYSRKDVGLVNELYEKLKGYGYSPWQDHRDIIGGKWLDGLNPTKVRNPPLLERKRTLSRYLHISKVHTFLQG